MTRRPPKSTCTYTLFPYTTLCRSPQPRAFRIDVGDQRFSTIIGLADPVGAEGVGRHDVGPRRQIGLADRRHDILPRQREDVVVALLVVRQAEGAGIVGLGKFANLDLGAPAAVGEEDALLRCGVQGVACAAGHAAFSLAGAVGRSPSIWQIA